MAGDPRKATRNHQHALKASGGLLKRPNFMKAVFDMLEKKIDSPYLLGFLVDYYEAELEIEARMETLESALQLCERLANDADSMRKNYWNYISRTLKTKFGSQQ
eukprot:gene5668-6364_t